MNKVFKIIFPSWSQYCTRNQKLEVVKKTKHGGFETRELVGEDGKEYYD